ncbi:hypothetical protein [Streptomyces sp. URMC 123]|uniref:hypothetical protein n=1 Tax=Streptomyces sp. URMC 123 TaxID=3423403 RepID=UPI003F1B4395
MRGSMRGTGRGSAVVAMAGAALLALSQGTAFAATGWQLPNAGSVPPGTRVQLSMRMTCAQSSPCAYDNSLRLRLDAENGARVLNQTGTLDFVRNSDGARVGTCQVSAEEVVCAPSGSGSVGPNDSLRAGTWIVGQTASSTCTTSFTMTWWDSSTSVEADPGQFENWDPGQFESWENEGANCGV